ncbi:MAG: ammonium transporter [Prevotellaceae bacterium]|jgi:Amt family ammonium transporter|nr:ammonium transporter [Prevotellaceae bacterium]
MKKRWIILFSILILVSISGLFATENESLFTIADVNINQADVAWMITAALLVLLMTPGLSFFYGGMVRSKNIISTMLQSFIAMGIISVVWVVFGFSLTFGDDIGGVIGNPATFFMFKDVGVSTHELLAPTIPLALFALFQMKFAILTPSLITGSFAERVRFSSYIIFMLLFSIFVYAPLAHCTWHPEGLFKQMGVIDFAGGIVVHASSGTAALAGAMFLGRRSQTGKHRPANIPFVLLGTALLWIGWFGFNSGSALAADGIAVKAFLNTNTASAMGMLTWLFFDGIRGRKMSATGTAIGAVVGLVGITPSAGYVTVGESMFIGLISAIICNIAVYWKNKSSLDDALDVFPTHGIGGIVGTILTGVFVNGLLDGHIRIFFNHILAVLIVMIYTFVVTYGLYWLTNKIVSMRVSPASERIGLDISQHNERYGFEE